MRIVKETKSKRNLNLVSECRKGKTQKTYHMHPTKGGVGIVSYTNSQ